MSDIIVVEDLIGPLKIEEENRIKDKGTNVCGGSSKVNMVEFKNSNHSVKTFKRISNPEEEYRNTNSGKTVIIVISKVIKPKTAEVRRNLDITKLTLQKLLITL